MSNIDTYFKSTSKIYWTVHGQKTYSKIQALMWAGGDISKISFYFFDKEWADKSWNLPPTQSLSDLIDNRCKQLRDQSNHLCLWLSSGYDSVTILNRFAKLNIFLDEIVVYQRSESDPEYPLARELAYNYQVNSNPKVKITELLFDYKYLENVYSLNREDLLFYPGFSLRMSKSQAHYISRFDPSTIKLLTEKSDRIDINGFEKPRVTLYNNAWYSMFPDAGAYDAIGTKFVGFWLDEDCFDLYHAACWSTIAWMETLPNISNDLVHRIQNNDPQFYPEWSMSCGRDLVTNNYSHRGIGKSRFHNNMHSPDSLDYENYFKTYNTHIWDQYVNNLKTVQLLLPEWKDITQPVNTSALTITSKSHYLRPFKKFPLKSMT